MKRWKLLVLLLLMFACQGPPKADPLASLYWSISEETEDLGLRKSYSLDSLSLQVDLHWPNPETGKEQQLSRVDSIAKEDIRTLFKELDSLTNAMEAPWGWGVDSLISSSESGNTQLLFRLQSKNGRLFRIQMPEDYPREKLPETVQAQLKLFEAWVKRVERKEPLLE